MPFFRESRHLVMSRMPHAPIIDYPLAAGEQYQTTTPLYSLKIFSLNLCLG
jgi:hypothetical protein